jgi:hypothetical protein
MDIDFNNIEIGEDLSKDSHSAVEAQEFMDLQKQLRIHAKKYNRKIISDVQMSRDATNPITSEQYNARLYTMMHIIRNPEYSNKRYPLKDTWSELYTIPYPEKMTSTPWSKNHRDKLKELLKSEGMYKHVEYSKTRHFVERVNAHYMSNKVLKLEAKITALELQLSDSGNIWYRGIEIVRQSRHFKVEVNGNTFTTRHGTFDKLLEFLKQIDERLS